MTIKLIACDLDGTLIGPDFCFSPRLLRAMQRARERGITVSIATGRGYPSMVHYARRLGVTAPVICYQGAQINTMQGETLYEMGFPRKYLPDVIAFCEEGGWELTVYCDDEIYQTTRLYDRAFYDRWFGLPTHHVDDLSAALPGEPIKLLITAPTKASADSLEPQLQDLSAGRFQVIRSHDWFVEGLASGVSKGDALARLAARLRVAREEVMALGDSDNDASMIAWAGLGIAMGNASPGLKSVATEIAPTQAEDGAAWAIERHALDGGP
jgi:Cof subfamily protein (haloacid dehalogenase superfamily)